MSNVRMSFKQVNTINLMTSEWCFLISKIMRTTLQCHLSLYYVMYLGTLSFTVQRLWFLFSDAAGNEHCLLVEIPVKRSTFNSNIQKQAFQDHYN